MPPTYAYFLYFVKIISFNKINFISLVIFLQVILSTYSIYIFYLINKNFFSEKLCLINSFIFTFLPLNIYAPSKISSITLQIFLSLIFLHFFIFVN